MNLRYLVLVVVSLAVAVSGEAAQQTAEDLRLITNVDHRETVSLNGDWHTIVDPYEVGYYDYRWRPSQWGFFRDEQTRDESQLIEYNFDDSPVLRVPGDWNTQRDDLYYYEGTVWYRKAFSFERREEERVFLHFGAVNYEARGYLNGKPIGRHTGGFTPFQFEVTDVINSGENSLVLKVDNRREQDEIPTVNTDWWNYGGITRRVLIVRTPKTFVRDYLIQLDPEQRGTIRGWVQLDGADPTIPGMN